MGKYEKGSFTVEAAAVAPMTLFVVLFLLSLLFYVHDFAWYTAAAWESVIGGCGECSDSSVDITEEILRRARKRETQYWTEQPLSMELNAGKTKVKAEYRGTVPFLGDFRRRNTGCRPHRRECFRCALSADTVLRRR